LVGAAEESPLSRHLQRDDAVGRSFEQRARISNAIGFAEHREFRRRDFGDTLDSPGPKVSHWIFGHRLHCRECETESGAERPQAILLRFRRRDNLHQAAYGGRPERAVPRFEEFMDPIGRKPVPH
jgi:hypothetical protein